jgi:hypothetical protein
MTLKKLLGWAVVAFIGWYIFTSPHAAGNAVHNLLGTASQAAQSMAVFVGNW